VNFFVNLVIFAEKPVAALASMYSVSSVHSIQWNGIKLYI